MPIVLLFIKLFEYKNITSCGYCDQRAMTTEFADWRPSSNSLQTFHRLYWFLLPFNDGVKLLTFSFKFNNVALHSLILNDDSEFFKFMVFWNWLSTFFTDSFNHSMSLVAFRDDIVSKARCSLSFFQWPTIS